MFILLIDLPLNLLLLQCNEIRKANSNLIIIGKTSVENDKEDFDNDADDDEGDNAEESEGDEFEQETGWNAFYPYCLYINISIRCL